MTRLFAILPVVLAPLLLVSACTFPNPNYRDMPDASVIQRSERALESVAVADIAAPTPAESAAIAAALARGGDSGLRVRVRLPQGVPVPPQDEMRRRIAALGIDPAIAVVEPNRSEAGAALVFVRITVAAPNCADLVTPSETFSSAQRPSVAFGCANYTNLSNMLVDPADLAVPRGYGGADGSTSASAVDRYHADKIKPLKKSTAATVIQN